MNPAVTRERSAAKSFVFATTTNVVFKTHGLPFMMLWCSASSSGSVKIKGTDLPDVAEADATWKTLRSSLNAGTTTETQLDPNTATGTLAVGDFLIIDCQGMGQIMAEAAAGTGSLRATSFESMDGFLFILQKILDGGLTATVTGGATEAKQDTQITHLSEIEGAVETLETDVGTGSSSYSEMSAGAVLTSVVKASAGVVRSIDFFSIDATPVYVRLYNMTTAPGSGDAANIKRRILIPAVGSGLGGGVTLNFGRKGLAFSTGIGIRATTGIADNDTGALTASEVLLNVTYD